MKFTLLLETVEKMFKQDNCLLYLAFSMVLIGAGMIQGIAIIIWIGAVLLFAVFDSLGHHYLLKRGNDAQESEPEYIVAYRNIQVAFQIILTAMLWLVAWKIAIAFLVSWWLGVCDLMYYVTLRQKFTEFKAMSWLSWTPYGLIDLIFKIRGEIKPVHLIIGSILGIIISLNILIYV